MNRLATTALLLSLAASSALGQGLGLLVEGGVGAGGHGVRLRECLKVLPSLSAGARTRVPDRAALA